MLHNYVKINELFLVNDDSDTSLVSTVYLYCCAFITSSNVIHADEMK